MYDGFCTLWIVHHIKRNTFMIRVRKCKRGQCRYGDGCAYAHGWDDVRTARDMWGDRQVDRPDWANERLPERNRQEE